MPVPPLDHRVNLSVKMKYILKLGTVGCSTLEEYIDKLELNDSKNEVSIIEYKKENEELKIRIQELEKKQKK